MQVSHDYEKRMMAKLRNCISLLNGCALAQIPSSSPKSFVEKYGKDQIAHFRIDTCISNGLKKTSFCND